MADLDFNDVREWYLAWKRRPGARDALDAFAALTSTPRPPAIDMAKWNLKEWEDALDQSARTTLNSMICTCYQAAHYDPQTDPGDLYRKQMRRERSAIKARLHTAAGVLAHAANGKSKALEWAMTFAQESSGVAITRIDHSSGPEPAMTVAARYFIALEGALQAKLPEVDGGPFLNLYTYGNLHYQHATGGRGAPRSLNAMLAFELAYYTRMFTAGRATDLTFRGLQMPSDGNPSLNVVAKFCAVTLYDSSFTEKEAAIAISKAVKAGATLGEWP